jgi:anti-sigma regulatory factor (Ser/Thr protein kinase)
VAWPARPGARVPGPGDGGEGTTLNRVFDAGTLTGLRDAVLAEAAAAGMPGDRAADVMLAAHELAANVVRHGAGAGRLAIRIADGCLYCQVSDVGPVRGAGRAGRAGAQAAPPWPVRHGHGLWIVEMTADQVSVSSGLAGSRVTAVFTLPGSPR